MTGHVRRPEPPLGRLAADYLTPDEVAAMLRVSPKSIYRWAKQDATMPVLKIGHVVRFPRERLQAWLEDREQGLRPMRKLLHEPKPPGRGSTPSGTSASAAGGSAAPEGRALPGALSGQGIA